jgi:hypothetical protein
MTNVALLLVILTWQRMLLEHFHDKSNEIFFELGNYSARIMKYAAAPLDNLYLIRRDRIKKGQDTQFFSFDCFEITEELPILQWADYILQQDTSLETTNEKKQDLERFKIDQ